MSQNSASNIYITDAAQYIFAYLQLGFGYLEYQSLFDHVLQKAGIPTNYIKELQKTNPYVTLNKDRLRSIIGRWPASPYNSHTITQVVNEIISHVENNDLGEYNYYTAKRTVPTPPFTVLQFLLTAPFSMTFLIISFIV